MLGDRIIPYDYLVVATGARDSYFGRDDWAAVTLRLKDVLGCCGGGSLSPSRMPRTATMKPNAPALDDLRHHRRRTDRS
jgi:hypothetical protein